MIVIQLDVNAVRSLVGDNEQFELDLRKGVMTILTQNVVEQIKKKLDGEITQLIAKHVLTEFNALVRKTIGTKDGWSAPKLSDDFQSAIVARMNEAVDAQLTGLRARAEVATRDRLAEWEANVEEHVNKRVDRISGQQIDQLVDAKVKALLAKAAAAAAETATATTA